jgi:hypothetical protein
MSIGSHLIKKDGDIMALEKKMELESGIALSRSYAKITGIRLDVANKMVYLDVSFYADKEARAYQKQPVMAREYALYSENFGEYFAFEKMDQQGVNVIKLGYLYIKTLEDFAGSVDV